MSEHKFDIEREDLYEYNKDKERTKKRLIEIAECGMEEVGIYQFGYPGIMGGLYIERVWSYSDENFKDYMDWAKGLIAEKSMEWLDGAVEEFISNNPDSDSVDITSGLNLRADLIMDSLERLKWNGRVVREHVAGSMYRYILTK